MSVVAVVSVVGALLAAGGYLEHKFGSKVSSRVASLEARVSVVETGAKTKGAELAAVVADAKKVL